MPDISHKGAVARLTATNSFPGGFSLSAFPNDVDPFDIPEVEIAQVELGTNGHMSSWSSANPVELTISVIPNTADHVNLQTVFDLNRPQKGLTIVRDKISITRILPDGSQQTFSGGKMLSGPPALSMASSGRLKTPSYRFAFETMMSTRTIVTD